MRILEDVPPPEPPNEEVLAAEAQVLRESAEARRECSLDRYIVRIYHPTGVDPEKRYMWHFSPDTNCIDIFINDNHPFVFREIESTGAYEVYTKFCVYDALAEWLSRRLSVVRADTFPHYKDALMRGPGLNQP